MAFVRCKRSLQWDDVFSCTFQEWFINVMKMDLSYNSEPQKASAKDASFLDHKFGPRRFGGVLVFFKFSQ